MAGWIWLIAIVLVATITRIVSTEAKRNARRRELRHITGAPAWWGQR